MAIAIAGCHRSGTSMVTHMLSCAGLNLGANQDVLICEDVENKKGYWENSEIQNINDTVLKLLGGAWYFPRDFVEGWQEAPGMLKMLKRAEQFLADQPVNFLFKDPRTSVCLPFWLKVKPDLKLVMVLRHPLDVARSLASRKFSIALPLGLFMWAEYNRRIILDGPENILCVVQYENFFENKPEEMKVLLGSLKGFVADEVENSEIDKVSDLNLRNQGAEIRKKDECDPALLVFYGKLIALHGLQKDSEFFREGIRGVRNYLMEDSEFNRYIEKVPANIQKGLELANKLSEEIGEA